MFTEAFCSILAKLYLKERNNWMKVIQSWNWLQTLEQVIFVSNLVYSRNIPLELQLEIFLKACGTITLRRPFLYMTWTWYHNRYYQIKTVKLGRSNLSTWIYQFSYNQWSQAMLRLVSTWMEDGSSVVWVLLLSLKVV